MKFFRNPEIRRLCTVYLLLAILFTGIAGGFGCAGLVAGVCIIYIGISLAVTYQRYRKIEELAASIDRILHGNERISFTEYQEGELSVLEDELSKMTNRLLEQAGQLQQDKKYLSDAMADISHQLRSPLTSSQLVLSLLKDMDREQLPETEANESAVLKKEAALNEELIDVKKIYTPAETRARRQLLMEQEQLLSHMGWLIESMLKMSKMDAGTAYLKKETVYVRELLQKALEPVLIPMELRGICCIQTGVTDDASFTGDLAWCSEAILNIVKNCMEHTACRQIAESAEDSGESQERRDTATGGGIAESVDDSETSQEQHNAATEGGTVEITCKDTPLYLQLTIEDDGEGFAPEDLPHIFERFYKGKNASGQSVGIGLALARMIIAEMNGTIKAENRPQGGARFTICFYRQETV